MTSNKKIEFKYIVILICMYSKWKLLNETKVSEMTGF